MCVAPRLWVREDVGDLKVDYSSWFGIWRFYSRGVWERIESRLSPTRPESHLLILTESDLGFVICGRCDTWIYDMPNGNMLIGPLRKFEIIAPGPCSGYTYVNVGPVVVLDGDGARSVESML